MNNRFKLERSQNLPGWWVLTDLINLIVVKFKEHEFNETQQTTILEESMFTNRKDCSKELAHIMSEIGNYVRSHCYSIAMPILECDKEDE